MAQGLETDLKQMVLSGGPFGPQEIKQIVDAIAEDFSQYRALRDAVAELEAARRSQPGRVGAVGRLLLTCWAAIRPPSQTLEDGRRRGAGPLLSGQDLLRAGAIRRRDRQLRRGRQGRLQRRRLRAGPGRSAARQRRRHGGPGNRSTRCPAPSSKRPSICISAARRSRPWAATRAKSSPCSSGPSRPTPITPARCSAWRWKTIAAATTTSALRSVRALGRAVSDARRHAVEPGRAVRRSPAVRPGPAVLPADSGRRIPNHPRARLFLKDAAGLGRHVLRRRRAAPPRPLAARCSAFRSPISSCRSAAAIACRRWASRRWAT